jgi:oxygen-independent coproporphyrinogen-3 oxidase
MKPIGVYVHWPFCRSKCPYCDFNSHVRATIDEARWRAAYRREIDHWKARLGERVVTSIFFGGGTPSLMDPRSAAAILERIAEVWRVTDDIEITLEANPNSAEADRFRDFRTAGINRVSIGVQALDDSALRFLGRAHNADEARGAIAAAAKYFERFSFDLIYALPGQDRAAWRRELDEALSLAGEHLSLYQLTIEDGTRFAQLHARGELVMPDDETSAALFDLTQERMARVAMPAYEISNHAHAGGACRHNLLYWRYGSYLGIGPGAHGRLDRDGRRWSTRNARAPETWLAAVERDGHGSIEETPIAPRDAAREALLMGLRLDAGIDPASFGEATGVALEDALDQTAIGRLVADGFVQRRADGGISATASGRRVLNAVIAAIAA